jgi:hypothetical protein
MLYSLLILSLFTPYLIIIVGVPIPISIRIGAAILASGDPRFSSTSTRTSHLQSTNEHALDAIWINE